MKLLLLILLGLPLFSCEEVAPPTVEPEPTVEEILFPQQAPAFTFLPELILEKATRVNPNAEIAIYAIDDPEMFAWFSGLHPEATGWVIGLFRWDPSGQQAPRMYIQGKWSTEVTVAIHEYQHYLEYMLPNCRVELREAFLKMSSDKFSFCAGDLRGPAEANTEAPTLNPYPVTNFTETPEFKETNCEP